MKKENTVIVALAVLAAMIAATWFRDAPPHAVSAPVPIARGAG